MFDDMVAIFVVLCYLMAFGGAACVLYWLVKKIRQG